MRTKTIKTTDELLALRNDAGVIEHDGDLRIECDVPWRDVGEKIAGIRVRGYLDVRGDYCIIAGDLLWAQMHIPTLPERTYIQRVFPHTHQREYWAQRLGMELTGCYEDITKTLLPKIHNLLKDEKWTPTERWMLETLRDSVNEPPEWVEEVRKEWEEK